MRQLHESCAEMKKRSDATMGSGQPLAVSPSLCSCQGQRKDLNSKQASAVRAQVLASSTYRHMCAQHIFGDPQHVSTNARAYGWRACPCMWMEHMPVHIGGVYACKSPAPPINSAHVSIHASIYGSSACLIILRDSASRKGARSNSL